MNILAANVRTHVITHSEVHQLLATQGTNCLPLIMVDGYIISRRGYPTREILNLWTMPSPLGELMNGLAAACHGVVLAMGKEGFGKTSVGVGLAERGFRVHLSTTDPAAHLAATIAGDTIEPYAWVINQNLLPLTVTDPVLQRIGR